MTLAELRDRLVADGCDKHDQVIMLIYACLEGGLTEGTKIVRAIAALGFDIKHVGIQLQRHTGRNPDRHNWHKDDLGQYRLLH